MPLLDLPDDALLRILEAADYDLNVLKSDKRMHGMSPRAIARYWAHRIITNNSIDTVDPYHRLSIMRIIEIVARGHPAHGQMVARRKKQFDRVSATGDAVGPMYQDEDGTGASVLGISLSGTPRFATDPQPRSNRMSSLRDAILEAARDETSAAHAALLVRAPFINDIVHNRVLRRTAVPGLIRDHTGGLVRNVQERRYASPPLIREAAMLLFTILRPAIVRAIRSETIGGAPIYTETGRALELLVQQIGCEEPGIGDMPFGEQTMLQYWIDQYVAGGASRDLVVSRSGPMCFWRTSCVKNFSGAFQYNGDARRGHVRPVQLRDFSADLYWDTSVAENMTGMFASCAFNGAIDHLDVSRVRSFRSMFWSNRVFDRPLSSWRTSSARTMAHMFGNAASFDRPIESWDVARVGDMREMFQGARAFNRPLARWNASGHVHAPTMFDTDAQRRRTLA
jgi:hypothetical protein